MLNLSELAFKVNTEALVDAANKVAALGKAVDGLSTTFSKLEKNSSQASKAQAKAEKDLAAAEVDRAKAADIAAKTEERKAKAVRDTTKATEESNAATKASVSILERQREINGFVSQGFTQGQASIMASAKAAGALKDELTELGNVMKNTRSMIGGNPFDKSLNGLEALRNEYQVLTRVQSMMVQGLNLTQKQMKELALDEIRLTAAMKAQGKSVTETSAAISKLNKDYIQVAGGVNAVTQAEKELADMHRDAANANAYLEKEMQRVNFALQAQNNELNKGTANALNRFEQNLKRSGLTLDQQRVKLEEYRKGLLALEKTKGGNTDYITRALGPQITDIFVGLATGQAPLTVMLQQGGQLRDQFALAGVAAEDMGKTMRTAARDMVVSVAAVAKAFGDLLLGAFIDTGKGIVNLIGNVTGLSKVLEYARYQLTLFAMSDSAFGAPLLKFFNMLRVAVIGLAATMTATGIGALIAMAVAFKQVVSENNELAKSLALSGGALGLTHSSAIEYVKTLGEVGVTTGKATEAISAMAKAGVFAKDDILLVGKAAADMSTYAGIGVDETVKHFAKLKEKPVEALLDIAKATGMVAPEVLQMVIELEKSGKSADAAALAMKTYGEVTATQVVQMKENYNGFSLFIIELGKGIKQFFSDTFKTLFLATDPTEQLKDNLGAIQKRIKEVQDNQKTNSFFGISADPKLLDNLKEQERQLLKNLDRQVANNQAKEQELVLNAENARIEAAKLRMFESTEDKLDKQLKKTKTLGEWQAFYTDKQIEKLAKEANVNKDQIKLTDEQIEKTKELAKVEWDRAQKKGKKDPTENYYATLMREATNATIKADEATQDLTKSQIKMLEVIADPRFAKLNEDQKSRILSTYAQAAADEKIVAGQELINKLLGKGEGLGKEYYDTLKQLEGLKGNAGIDQVELEKALQALRDTTPAAKKAKEEIKAAAEAYKQYAENAKASLEASKVENEQLDFRVSLMGKTTEEQRLMRIQQDGTVKLMQAEVKYAKEVLKIRQDTRFQADPMRMAKALQDAEEAFAEERKTINRGVAVAFAEDIQNEINKVRSGITESIVTALFEGGKAGAKKFREVIVGVLRQKVTIVVDAVVNTLVGSVIGQLVGALGGGAGGGGILGMLGMGMQGYNIWTGLTSGSGILGSIGSFLGLGGGSAVAGAITGAGATGLGLSAGAGGLGLSAGGGGLGLTLGSGVGTGAAATGGGGIMGALSSIPGWGWALGALALLGSLGDDSGTFHTGGLAQYSAAGGSQTSTTHGAFGMGFGGVEYGKATTDAMVTLSKGLVEIFDGIAKTFGKTAGYEVAVAFADDTSKDGAWGGFRVALQGKDIMNWDQYRNSRWAPKEFGDGEEGYKQYLSAVAKDTRKILLDMDLPSWADKILNDIGDTPTMETVTAAVQQIIKIKTGFDELTATFKNYVGISEEAQAALLDVAGGIEALTAAAGYFYDNFYSDEEKATNLRAKLTDEFKKLGIVMPKTKEEFRKIVDGLDLNTESGRNMYAALLKLAPMFNQMVTANENLAAAEQDRINAAADAAKKAIEEQIRAQKEMLTIQLEAAQELANNWQKVFDFLNDQVKKLYGSVDSVAKVQDREARNLITAAVAGGTMPDLETLQDAVNTVTSGMASRQYASKVEADRDKLRFAAQLDDLKGTAEYNLKQAKNTVDLLTLQLKSLDDLLENGKDQIDAIVKVGGAVDDVVAAINSIPAQIANAIANPGATGSGSGTTPRNPGGGGGDPAGPNPYTSRVDYSPDEALTSFEKFKAWYVGLRTTAGDMNKDYKVPDWLRVTGFADDSSNAELFGQFLFFKNNPKYAKDFQEIMSGGTSAYDTSGASLVKTDLTKLPANIAEYFKGNIAELLQYEGLGYDPVLAYEIYKNGPEQYGIDPKTTNIAQWLRGHKWTATGIVENDNPLSTARTGYRNYNVARYDSSMGAVVDIDGTIYSFDGQRLGTASLQQMRDIYGEDWKPPEGSTTGVGETSRSDLYNRNISSGMSEDEYYKEIRRVADLVIAAGATGDDVAKMLIRTGTSMQDLAHAYGTTPDVIAQNLRDGGARTLPAFAEGGVYAGGLALVGEEGPELINFNRGGYVHNAGQTAAMLGAESTSEQLAALNSKVEMLEAAARSTAISNNKIAKILERVTPDGNSLTVNSDTLLSI